jgi:head-tail adaptor
MTTIGQLTERFTILQPTSTENPDTGGRVPGPPVVVADVRGALEPMTATEALSTLGRLTQQDLGIVNTATHVLTTWFRPDVTVGQFVEYQDAKRQQVRHFEITQVSSPEERGVFLVLGCIERVQ